MPGQTSKLTQWRRIGALDMLLLQVIHGLAHGEHAGSSRDAKQLARFATAIKEKNEELADYEQARAAYPTEALALLTAGWLDHEQASFVYGPVRFLECVTWLRDGPLKKWKKCEARASLVPFQGGQVLMLSLCYTEADGMDNVINCLDWITVDNANGDLADKPPMGIASEQSLKYAPMRINMFVEELQQSPLEARKHFLFLS